MTEVVVGFQVLHHATVRQGNARHDNFAAGRVVRELIIVS